MSKLLYAKLNDLATPVHNAISELGPRLRPFAASAREQFGLPEAGYTIGIGTRRLVVVFPDGYESWTAVSFDSNGGGLIELGRSTSSLTDAQVPMWVLTAAIDAIRDQVEFYDNSEDALAPEDDRAFDRLSYQLAAFERRLAGSSQSTNPEAPQTSAQAAPDHRSTMWAPSSYDAEGDYRNTPGRVGALLLGLLSVVFLPFAPIFAIPAGIAGVIVACIALAGLPAGPIGRGLPTSGLVLGIVGLVAGIAVGAVAFNNTFG
jgi:hypothetical protein